MDEQKWSETHKVSDNNKTQFNALALNTSDKKNWPKNKGGIRKELGRRVFPRADQLTK